MDKKTHSVTETAKLNQRTRILKKTIRNQFVVNIPAKWLKKSNIIAPEKLKLVYKPLNGKLLMEVSEYE